jgi:tetratricopeptide (TPR) repeat protein
MAFVVLIKDFAFCYDIKLKSLFINVYPNYMNQLKKSFAALVFFLVAIQSIAQNTKIQSDADYDFKLAKSYWQKEQFSLAYTIFKRLYSEGTNSENFPTTILLESKYYTIFCGLKLNDPSAEALAIDFINLEHNAPRLEMMSFQLAEYYYRQKKFWEANTYYAKSKIQNLSNREIADMKFHQAYVYFTLQQFDKAKPLFNSIKQLQNDPNEMDAHYYFGFISFYEKNYKQALESFKIVETHPSYQSIVPFYISEIYYFNGEKEKAISYAENTINKGGQYYDLQLRQLVGHAYFEKRKFKEALPYLETFVNKNEKVRREDLYELSFCYYETKSWENAIKGLKQLGGKEDSLAQNSMYLLADAYLKVNDKPNARNAFLFCASNSSNAVQKEISQFSYAKLSYELGFMDIALREVQNFLSEYSKSKFIQDAKELLVSVLANTSNYKEALALFDSLPQQSDNIKKVYPKILYGRAVELINDQQIDKADEIFIRLMQVPYNSQQMQFVFFWKGEIAYRNGKTEEALDYFTKYLRDAKTNGEVNPSNARYNAGYCELKSENYKNALGFFQQVSNNINSSSTNIQQDAYLRTADCYYMLKDFKQSTIMYDKVIELNLVQADYALYQKAIINGANNKLNEKINLLQGLSQRYPKSLFIPDANLEIGNTYLAEEKWQEAIPFLEKIIKDNRGNSLHPVTYLKIGIANFNLDKNDESLAAFKSLVTNFPNSSESDDAVEYIRKIFVENQKPGEFIAFMKQNGKPISYNEEDSLTFKSAMLRYEVKDYTAAKIGFAEYISKFAEGRYFLEANYFTAEINIASKDFNAALPFYNAVAAKAPNRYAERSTLQSARIYYFDLKSFGEAEKYYTQLKSLSTQQENKLEAMRGLLRCQYKQQKFVEAAANAQELLQEKVIAADDKMMATMVLAKSNQLTNKLPEALASYKAVIEISKSEFSAEAQFRIAEILLQQNKLPEAEKAGFEVIKRYGSYEYWVTRSYILLGDVYATQKDYFNAEATYKSVVENTTIIELKKMAENKVAAIIAEKNKINKVEQTEQ